MKNKYAIVNVDKKRNSSGNLNKGTHWVAICSDKSGKLLIFDSFGRQTKKLLQHLYKKMKKSNIKYNDTEYDVDQYLLAHCGQLCVAFLKFYDMYGADKAKYI